MGLPGGVRAAALISGPIVGQSTTDVEGWGGAMSGVAAAAGFAAAAAAGACATAGFVCAPTEHVAAPLATPPPQLKGPGAASLARALEGGRGRPAQAANAFGP